MTALGGIQRRVVAIEKRCGGGGRAVRIVRKIQNASDEELYWMNENGEFERMASQLNARELDWLADELRAMHDRELPKSQCDTGR